MTGLTIMTGSQLRKRPVPTRPSFRAMNNTTSASATSIVVAIPASAVVGDMLIVNLVVAGSRTLTSYTGPALTTPIAATTTNATPSQWMAYRVIQTGDAGSNMTFGISGGAASMLVEAAVYKDTSGFSILPQLYTGLITVEPANSRPPRLPSIATKPYDLIVGLTAAHSYVSTNANGAQLATIPSGATQRHTDSTPTTGLVLTFGIGIFDAPAHDLRYEWCSFNQASNFQSVIFALAPVADGWTPERAPTTLSGKPVFVYTNSMSAFVRRQEANWGYNSMRPWGERIITAMGNHASSKNLSLPGSRSQDICTAAYGTDTSYSTRSTLGDPMTLTRALTWSSYAVLDSLILTDFLGNDAIHGTAVTQDYTAATNAVVAMLKLFRASALKNYNDASIAYTGSWSDVTSTGYMAGTAKLTTTPNDIATITFTGDKIDLIFIGTDDARFATGSTFSVTVDGVSFTTGTISNQAASTGWGNNYGFCQMVVSLTGMGAGAHSIVVKHTGSSGNRLVFNGYIVPSSGTVPWIVLNTIEYISDATLTTLGVTRTQLNNFNALLPPIAAAFTDGKVVLYDSNASGVWDSRSDTPDPATLNPGMISTDGVHMNEIGHAFYAKEIMRMLSERAA